MVLQQKYEKDFSKEFMQRCFVQCTSFNLVLFTIYYISIVL